MTRRLGPLVTDASPLIRLAAADALECLAMPGLRVLIPDMDDAARQTLRRQFNRA